MDAIPNLATGTVANSPGTGGLTIELQAGQGVRFAETPPFNAQVHGAGESPTPSNTEIVRVTARSGDKLTIERIQEKSTARNIKAGDVIYVGVTAGLFNQLAVRAETICVNEQTGLVPNVPTIDAAAPTRAVMALSKPSASYNLMLTYLPGTYCMKTAVPGTTQIAGYGSVNACAIQPVNTGVFGRDRASLVFEMDLATLPAPSAEKPLTLFLPEGKLGAGKTHRVWSKFTVKYRNNASPPNLESRLPPRASPIPFIFKGSGVIEDILVAPGGFAAMVHSGDHFSVYNSDLSGWARIIWPSEFGKGNNVFYNCALTAGYCMGFIEEGAQIAGTTFEKGHMGGCFGPYFWCPVGGNGAIAGIEFVRVWFEGGARGIIICEDQNFSIRKLKSKDVVTGAPDAPISVGKVGDPEAPIDAYIKCGNFEDAEIIGRFFATIGTEPEAGCMIRAAGNVCRNELGELTAVIPQARGLNLPLIRAQHAWDNTGWTIEESVRSKIAIVRLKEGSINRGDLAHVAAPRVVNTDHMAAVTFGRQGARVVGAATQRARVFEPTGFTANTTIKSTILKNVSSTAGLSVGVPLETEEPVPGIQSWTQVARIGPAPLEGALPALLSNEIELTIPATGTKTALALVANPYSLWGKFTLGSNVVQEVPFFAPSLVNSNMTSSSRIAHAVINGVNPATRTITLGSNATKSSEPQETITAGAEITAATSTLKVKSTTFFLPGQLIKVGANVLTIVKLLSTTEFEVNPAGWTALPVPVGTAVIAEDSLSPISIEQQPVFVPFIVPTREQPTVTVLKTAHLGSAVLTNPLPPEVELQAAAAGATTLVAQAGQAVTGFPPKGAISVKIGTKTVTAKYGKHNATELQEVSEWSEALTVTAGSTTTLATWPPNARGATTTLAAPFELGQGTTAPTTQHDSPIYQKPTNGSQFASGPIWMANLSDLPSAGIGSAKGVVFKWRSQRANFPFQLNHISWPGAAETTVKANAAAGATQVEGNSTAGFPANPSTTLTAAAAKEAKSLKVASTAGWPSKGHLYFPSHPALGPIKYKATAAGEILEVSGITEAIANGATVILAVSLQVGSDGNTYDYFEITGNVFKLVRPLAVAISAGEYLIQEGPATGGTGFKTPIYRAAQVTSLEGFSANGGVFEIEYTAEAKTFKRLCMYGGVAEVEGKKYLTGVTCQAGPEAPAGATIVDKEVLPLEGPTANYPAGPAAAVQGGSQWTYQQLISRAEITGTPESEAEEPEGESETEEVEGKGRAYMVGLGKLPAKEPQRARTVSGGLLLKTARILGGTVTLVCEGLPTGWPSTGVLMVENEAKEKQELKYTGVTEPSIGVTEFTGVTGGAGTLPVGAAVTLWPGKQVAAEALVRARYSEATHGEGDKGLVATAANPYDPQGEVVGMALEADEGTTVVATV